MLWLFLFALCAAGRVESIYRGNIFPIAVKFHKGTGEDEINEIIKKCGIDTIEPFPFSADTFLLHYSPKRRWPRYLTAVIACLEIQTAVEWHAEQVPKVRVKRPKIPLRQI